MTQPRAVASISTATCLPSIPFQGLASGDRQRQGGRRNAVLFASAGLHAALAVAVCVLPLMIGDSAPALDTLRVFFGPPVTFAVPQPPPPPLGGGRAAAHRRPRVDTPPSRPPAVPTADSDVALPEIPSNLDDDSRGPGVRGGLRRGGVVGSLVSDLPPRIEARVTAGPTVRIGGHIKEPRKVRDVRPVYPELAVVTRVSAMVILEAEVDPQGRVTAVSVLRGHPLLDEAAREAVRQWRYEPLLLNGEPTGFILTVTVNFNLRNH